MTIFTFIKIENVSPNTFLFPSDYSGHIIQRNRAKSGHLSYSDNFSVQCLRGHICPLRSLQRDGKWVYTSIMVVKVLTLGYFNVNYYSLSPCKVSVCILTNVYNV